MRKTVYPRPVKPADDKEAYTIREAAYVLGISVPYAYALVHQEGFPAFRLAQKKILVPRAALLGWLARKAEQGLEQTK